MKRALSRLACSLALVASLAVFATPAEARSSYPRSDLVETLERAGQFETLLALLDVTDLTGTLAEGGPFTVFAPPTPPSRSCRRRPSTSCWPPPRC